MKERSEMVAWVRSEIVGPSRPLAEPSAIEFVDNEFKDPLKSRRGPLAWKPSPDADPQEVLYYERESPHRKYGAGLLHPAAARETEPGPSEVAAHSTDTIGTEPEDNSSSDEASSDSGDKVEVSAVMQDAAGADETNDFEVTSGDIRYPSTIGISICLSLNENGRVVVRLPQNRRFFWQAGDTAPFQLNGRYELCKRLWTDEKGQAKKSPVWRRLPAVSLSSEVKFSRRELVDKKVIRRKVPLPERSPLNLQIEVFPRKLQGSQDIWLLTVVLRNSTDQSGPRESRESLLYQTFFEVEVIDGKFEKYPESHRPFEQFDQEEQSLALLYRKSATWGVGHGCAAGWEADLDQTPVTVYSDVMPAVELPSMTPDIEVDGVPLILSMRSLAELSDDGTGPVWQSLMNLAKGYAAWIEDQDGMVGGLKSELTEVARRHLDACRNCLERIEAGINKLKTDARTRQAFRLANLAMLLQQIATKQLEWRPLSWDASLKLVSPQGEHKSPWIIYKNGLEDSTRLGNWRAFQIAFLLMSLEGIRDGDSKDREIVDLVWFPTGGGKTEAYLAVTAFYMFHERLLMDGGTPARDGTNVLMRYTLRMLTTQQFQRAASLVCGMEYLRRNFRTIGLDAIPGKRFSLGLWIGGEGSPNKIRDAREELRKFRDGYCEGNPLVLTECPWCRAEIGRFSGPTPREMKNLSKTEWNTRRTRGISDDRINGPQLHCPDGRCEFGQENSICWLPVEVIDERIYDYPPSLVIATADKLAMIAYRPEAGALFGRRFPDGNLFQESMPPGLIIQDELHLISGPLGTMYALYEGIIENLCSYQQIKPKIIASTATIRGAAAQVNALYARTHTQLFPSPGLEMGDSFFGKYATDDNGKLCEGRLYLGIHAIDYGSVLTAQVRTFSSALFRPWSFASERRDPWWTLLAFYNSIRELGGARTLFDSDIRSRLKFMFNREGFEHDKRRNLQIVDELTSRLSQAEIVRMMDKLSRGYSTLRGKEILDACLASSIIEVGVDIDRLSLMGVVGQPKTTATYIQVTGRVGRRWWERPGLILMIYNPFKSRDRSHFEQFHSYHRRLYERVEPTTATPFAVSAIQRGFAGALIAWARQHYFVPVQDRTLYMHAVDIGYKMLTERCEAIQIEEDRGRSLGELKRVRDELEWKWGKNPQIWEEFPPKTTGEYLMLWPGQYTTGVQRQNGVVVPSSMRQVDRSAELTITQGYAVTAISDANSESRGD